GIGCELGRNGWPAGKGNVDLPAMGVPGQGQSYAGGHFREDIGLVGEKECRQIIIELAQGTLKIVYPAASKGELIAKPGDPKAVLPSSHLDGGILKQVNLSLLEAPADQRGLPAPPIVIAQNRIDAERRMKLLKGGHPFADRNERGVKAEPQRVHIIAQKHDD